MKSLAFSEISSKASSSKSYLATVTLAIVSMSVCPMNGDNPDNLYMSKQSDISKYVVLITIYTVDVALLVNHNF